MAHTGVDEMFERVLALMDVELKPAQAERLLRRVIDRLGPGSTPRGLTRDRALLSLAHLRAERGHVSEGLDILASLSGTEDPRLRGLVLSQRGLLLLRSGRFPEALQDLERAVPLLEGQPRPMVTALMNRGMLYLSSGALRTARQDWERCARLAAERGLPVHAARARHNLGYLRWLAGDLPAALAEMDLAYAEQSTSSPGARGVFHLDRARVLHAAGLLVEADAELSEAIECFAAVASRQDQAECELHRAQIALGEDRFEDAARMAVRARRRFERRGSAAWALLARLVQLRACDRLPARMPRLAVEAERLAAELAAAGLVDDALLARVLAARARLRSKRSATPEKPELHRSSPILVRQFAREVRAEVEIAHGRRRGAMAELRAGLRELHRYQASFGSLDLQSAVAQHGRGLAATGLQLAVARGNPKEIFDWAERAGSMASRIPPVRPPADPEAAGLLEQLRYIRSELRSLELAGRADPALRARRMDLERWIRQRSWYAPGPGEVVEPAAYHEVRSVLGDRALVMLIVVAGALQALVITAERARLVGLGPVPPVLEGIRRVRADCDVLAIDQLRGVMRSTVQSSLLSELDRLSQRLWAPISACVGDRSLVLVPRGQLIVAPWTMLPGLNGRPLTVAQSATAWLRWQHGPASIDPSSKVILAAGPDLTRAEAEVHSLSTLWPQSDALVGAAATGAAVRAGFGNCQLAHVAAHGAHESANPLFSAIRLADGPLFGYDVSRVPDGLRHVVLSACDLGLSSARPGGEALGMTAALLHNGVRSVIAAVARVSDDVAFDVMLAYHERLARGRDPAVALAEATQGRADNTFVCFGAGL